MLVLLFITSFLVKCFILNRELSNVYLSWITYIHNRKMYISDDGQIYNLGVLYTQIEL